ncbi:alginate lyase family protein [Flaviaesturariibacter amylovorans]
MKHVLLALFTLVFMDACAQAVGLTKKEVVALKKTIARDTSAQRFYTSLKRTADNALSEMPDPVDTVVSEGHLITHPKKIRTLQALKDIDKIYALALAYKVEGHPPYLQQAAAYLSAWATVNQPRGNPINDSKFEKLFFAYDLLRKDVPDDQRATIDRWLGKMADEEMRTADRQKKNSFSNWHSHRLKVIGLIAYVLDHEAYKNYVAEALPEHIERNLKPDGSGYDFHERDALHYHVYTLEPMISLATVLQRAARKDYYHFTSPSGASIGKSIDFLIPFVTGEKTHAEYVNSKAAFDKKRAANKEPGFEIGAPFKPTEGLSVLVQASFFEAGCIDVVRKTMQATGTYPTWQAVMNGAQKTAMRRK